MIEDLEDDYPEYIEDEAGYRWDAWDVLTADAMRRHDVIARSGLDRLAALDPAGLDDLERWAYARASRRLGDVEGFLAAARLLVASAEEHIAVHYPEVFEETIQTLANLQEFDEVETLLEAARTRWPDETDFARITAVVEVRRNQSEAASVVNTFVGEYADASEMLFEFAEDLAAMGLPELATIPLDAAEAAAAQSAPSTLVDVALLRARLAGEPVRE